MKKFISFLLVLCICFSMSIAFTACREEESTTTTTTTTPAHVHAYQSTWSKDATHHWYACTDATCTATSQKAEHSFSADTCTVCGYQKQATPPITQPSRYEVTQAQFLAAVSFENVTKATIQAESNEQGVLQETIQYDNGKMKYQTQNSFCNLVGDSVYLYYYLQETFYTGWVRSLVENARPADHDVIELIKRCLVEIDYEDCTYQDGYYLCTHTYEVGTVNESTENLKLQFDNAMLTFFRMENTSGEYVQYSISDYGNVTVTLPTNYKELDELITPPPSVPTTPTTAWASYFVFDNVTASALETSVSGTQSVTTKENYKVAGGRELLVYQLGSTATGQFEPIFSYTTYFDGTTTYVDGVPTTGATATSVAVMLLELLQWEESKFTETSSGVYEAASTDIGMIDVKLTVSGGKILSAEFKSTDGTYTTATQVTFSNWGTTTIDYQPSAS